MPDLQTTLANRARAKMMAERLKADRFFQVSTIEQRGVTENYGERELQVMINALRDAKYAQDSIVDLPHKNEAGAPVLAGCNNNRMRYIADYYLTQAKNARDVVSGYYGEDLARDIFDEAVKEGLRL